MYPPCSLDSHQNPIVNRRLKLASVPLSSWLHRPLINCATFLSQDFHAPTLSIPAVKAAVLVIFGAMFFATISLASWVAPGLEQQVALPMDSYLQVSQTTTKRLASLRSSMLITSGALGLRLLKLQLGDLSSLGLGLCLTVVDLLDLRSASGLTFTSGAIGRSE
jgi:hypothetical protein